MGHVSLWRGAVRRVVVSIALVLVALVVGVR